MYWEVPVQCILAYKFVVQLGPNKWHCCCHLEVFHGYFLRVFLLFAYFTLYFHHMLKILHLFNQLSYQCLLQSLVFLPPQGDYKNCGSEQCLEKGDQELAKKQTPIKYYLKIIIYVNSKMYLFQYLLDMDVSLHWRVLEFSDETVDLV